MDASLKSLPPGDPKLIENIVSHLKGEGIFDEFRKSCLADVDTKPAYQNLRTRVESFADDFLKNTQWRTELNKNQVREGLRRQIQDSGLITSGVDRIIEQVVNPKIVPFFLPRIVEIVYRLLGIVKQETTKEVIHPTSNEQIKLPTAPTQASTAADKSTKPTTVKETSEVRKNLLKSFKDVSKAVPVVKAKHSVSSSKPDGNKAVKAAEDGKQQLRKSASTDKGSSSPKIRKLEDSGKKTADAKSFENKDSKNTSKLPESAECEKAPHKHGDKTKLKHDSKEEKIKHVEKHKTNDKHKRREDDKSKPKDKSSAAVKKPVRSDGSSTSSETDAHSSSNQLVKGSKTSEKKEKSAHNDHNKDKKISSSKTEESRVKTTNKSKKPTSKEIPSKKRKLDEECVQPSKKTKLSSPRSESNSSQSQEKKKSHVNEENDAEMSDVTVSSVHTSDLSDFDDRISLSDIDDDDNSYQTSSKSTAMKNKSETPSSQISEDARAGFKVSEDALMSSDELRVSNKDNKYQPDQRQRRKRKLNPKYSSEDFSSAFFSNYEKQGHQSKVDLQKEAVSESSRLSSRSSSLKDKSELLGSPISETSELEGTANNYGAGSNDRFHSPILSSEDDLGSCTTSQDKFEITQNLKNIRSKSDGPSSVYKGIYSSETDSSMSPRLSSQVDSKKPSRSDSRQRYDSSELYKPRPVINQSRRRGSSDRHHTEK